MAKQQDKPKSTGVRTIKWRDAEVFGCSMPGCVFVHERKDRVEQHLRSGRHIVPSTEGPSRALSSPQIDPEPVEAPTPSEGGEE